MDAFYGEIRIFGFTFPPQNWAQCNGQTLQIMQFQVLYAVIGVQFGGDGQNTFKLPNLQGSAVYEAGQGLGLTPRIVGQTEGNTAASVNGTQMPYHQHTLNAIPGTTAQLVNTPTQNISYLARSFGQLDFTNTDTHDTTLSQTMLNPTGSSQGHENRQPYLTMNFCICVYGDYPVRP